MRFCRLPGFCACLIALLLFSGCHPRQQGASAQSFYTAGLANFSISVAPPLTLVASGRLTPPVPADVSLNPHAIFNYALFADPGSGPVTRQVHTIFAELPRGLWQWEKETWSLPQTISYAKHETGGKYWTVQILPVIAAKDWFSALWRENDRDVPEFWLAKRWSATPEDEMRLVAEYREPAPACMQQRLKDSLTADAKNSFPLHGKELRGNCEAELEAFSVRADQAVHLDRMTAPEQSPAGSPLLQKRPSALPDVGALAGRAQENDRDHDYQQP